MPRPHHEIPPHTVHTTHPTQGTDARQRLANAALAFGALESDRLDQLGLAVVGRVSELSDDAVRELADALDGERVRRAKG